MKKNMVHAALSLFMLVAFTTSIHAQWVPTNWQAGNTFFNLYTSQDRVFARTWDSCNGGRMFCTVDDGANWTLISSADSSIGILSIVMVNNDLLAGTWNGFYRSTSGGTSWNAVTPTGIPADSAIWSIAMISTTLYAGTRGAIYKSSDGGAAWTEVKSGIPVNARITSIVACGTAIFAGSDTSGVFRTTNGGTSWAAVNSGLADKRILQLAVMGTKLFAVTLKGVFVSGNNGASWLANGSNLRDINCFVAVNNQLFAGTDSSGVYLSADSGVTWTSYTSGMPASTRVWSLAAGSGDIFAGTSAGVWRTPLVDPVTYTITAGASEGGTISPEGDIAVYEHSSQTFTITPATGYRISNVQVDGAPAGAVASYTFSNVIANHTVSAVFTAVPIYTITASAGSGGTISPSGTVMVSEGSSATFTMTPSTGYALSSVMVDGSPVGVVSTYTFTNITGNHTISAAFVSAPYTITASAGSGGSISPSGTVTVSAGSSLTFTIAPSTGYEVSSVLIDGVSVGPVASFTFSSISANHTISVTFSSLTKYRINCGGSASSPFTADQYYSGGSTYSVTSAITTTGVTDPAPQAVYRTERYGNCTYTLPNLTIGASYKVRLHFAEIFQTAIGRRVFNVAINGTTVLSNYDIYAETGARYKAVVKEFTTAANNSGQIAINLTTVTDNAKIAGIEIIKTVTNTPPSIVTAASALPNPVTASTTALSALGADDKGESNLTYTWTATGTPPATVSFSANGTNGAKATTATFAKAGSYSFQVTATDQGGLTATSSVAVTADQTLTSMVVSPANVSVNASGTQQFIAVARDQFANALTTQPTFTWSVSGGGTISSSGLFTAGATSGGPYTVTAQSSSVSSTATVSINNAPTMAAEASASPSPVIATTSSLSALGADDNGESNLSYTWTATGTPPGAVMFSINGTNMAKATTVFFTKAGNYSFQVTVTDQGGLTVTSSVAMTVNQTLTSIMALPANVSVNASGTQQFTTIARDQFAIDLTAQPALTWSLSGGGAIDANGLFTAGTIAGTFMVTASSAGITGTAEVTVVVPNAAPTIARAASASPSPVTAATTSLSVLGADDHGESNLNYTWTTTGTPPATVTFSVNGTNAAKNSTATFTKAGSYTFQVTVTDAGGLTAASMVVVAVNQTLTSIFVSPPSVTLSATATQQFTATGRDQFGTSMNPQPVIAWSASGAGAIGSTSGLFTAGTISGTSIVTATSGSVSATASVTINAEPTTIYQINCGGSASSPYSADQYYSGGRTYSVSSTITTTGVTNPAPQAVYRTERYGTMTYTLPSLTSGASYKVRLHFAEIYWTATGKRKFNVAINGTTVLSNYDIYAETGARYKAVAKEYTAMANTSGQIVITLTNVTDNAKIGGIEIVRQ